MNIESDYLTVSRQFECTSQLNLDCFPFFKVPCFQPFKYRRVFVINRVSCLGEKRVWVLNMFFFQDFVHHPSYNLTHGLIFQIYVRPPPYTIYCGSVPACCVSCPTPLIVCPSPHHNVCPSPLIREAIKKLF